MNILFVGPYKQADEWGRKSRALLGALKRTGNLITSRPIYFSEPYWDYNEEAEYSSCEAYDAVIQFTVPAFAVYDGRFKKNIGFFNTDTIDHSPCSTSISRMKMLDEIWVENQHIHESLKNRLSDTRISLIKPYMDTSLEKDVATGRFSQGILRNGPFRDKFIFYSIGFLGEREGAEEAMCAYLSEFSSSDNCVLVYVLEKQSDPVKVNMFVEACFKRIGATKTREHRPTVHIMNPDAPLPAEARLTIHKEADCFLCPDYSLNCTTLTIEAVAAQSTPIINKNTAAYDLLGENGSWGVESYEERCMLNDRSFDDVFTANETCVKPTIKSLAHQMREAYTNKFLREKKRADNIKTRHLLESDAYYDSLKELLCS